MDFDATIRAAWNDHTGDAADTADRLADAVEHIAGPEQLGPYASVVGHVVGQHLHAWPRAAELIEQAIARCGDVEIPGGALRHLAVARYLAGDVVRAMATELRAAAVDEHDAIESVTVVRAMTAEALLNTGETEGPITLFRETVHVARQLPDEAGATRTMAIAANNMASTLLERDDRTPACDAAMAELAGLAREFWLRAGTWVNEERADYLLALVDLELGRHEPALQAADRALALIEQHGEQDVDRAFLLLARCRACRGLERGADADAALADADAIAAGFSEDWLTSWFADERKKAAV